VTKQAHIHPSAVALGWSVHAKEAMQSKDVVSPPPCPRQRIDWTITSAGTYIEHPYPTMFSFVGTPCALRSSQKETNAWGTTMRVHTNTTHSHGARGGAPKAVAAHRGAVLARVAALNVLVPPRGAQRAPGAVLHRRKLARGARGARRGTGAGGVPPHGARHTARVARSWVVVEAGRAGRARSQAPSDGHGAGGALDHGARPGWAVEALGAVGEGGGAEGAESPRGTLGAARQCRRPGDTVVGARGAGDLGPAGGARGAVVARKAASGARGHRQGSGGACSKEGMGWGWGCKHEQASGRK
jgi:hypothetical protein